MRRAELDALLRRLLGSGEGISDLNFTPGKPPQIDADGELRFPFVDPPLPELTPFMTERIALNLLGDRPDLLRELASTGSCDFAYTVPNVARLRVNVFRQRGLFSVVCRRLATRIPSIHDLALPPVFERIAKLHNGFVLVTGATGMGKSTTLAALVQEINRARPVHIVTLEDPIEFLHGHETGTVNQRELGTDFDSYASGLRAAMRQSPRVIVVGELRDRETMSTALSAAETGHLVFATMQTIGAGSTVHRIVGMFPTGEQGRIRSRLAEVLRYVVAQWLVPKRGGGRVAVQEILASTHRTRELILDGEREEKTFYRALSEGAAQGMQTFDQHLLRLLEEERIEEETARSFCSDRVQIGLLIDRLKAQKAKPPEPRAPATGALDTLRMDFTFGRSPRDGA